jgi:hypothetical protein
MATRNERIAANIAKRIVAKKTRLRFSTLHRLAIEETMNTRNTSCTTTGIGVGDNEDYRIATQTSDVAPTGVKPEPTGAQDIPIVVKDVNSTVIEGSHKSGSDDVSSKFSTDSFKNQAGPRGETGTKGA